MIRNTIMSRFFVLAAGTLALFAFAVGVEASHSWGGYHWARTTNPLTLKLGDNVSSVWDAYLATASADWSLSSVLDTTVVAGQSNPRRCSATSGRVEMCNSKYGNNGWLGIASVWVSGDHITQGTVKLNDTYFNTKKYNTPAWKLFVACQEIGHTFGLDHQDEAFNNPNLGTCMDYTNDPDGTLLGQLNNAHPDLHDYDQLAAIYAHLDSFTSSSSGVSGSGAAAAADIDTSDRSEWGKSIRTSRDGRASLYVRDLGGGQQVFTFVIWAQ